MLPTHLHRMRKAGTIDWVPVSSNHMAKTAPPRAMSKNQITLPWGQQNLSKALPTGQGCKDDDKIPALCPAFLPAGLTLRGV